MTSFLRKFQQLVLGVLSGFDRLFFRGTLRNVARRRVGFEDTAHPTGKALVAEEQTASAWRYRHENVVYRLMSVVTAPAVWLAARLLPPSWRSRYAPAIAFVLAACLYLALGLWHRDVCLRDLSQPACTKWAIARGLKQP